jgi:hypothetical protein
MQYRDYKPLASIYHACVNQPWLVAFLAFDKTSGRPP